MKEHKPIIIIGAGGWANAIFDILLENACTVIAFTATENSVHEVRGIPVISDEHVIAEYLPSDIMLVNGIGSAGSLRSRKSVFEKFKQYGFSFASVIHPTAVISRTAQLGEGVQVRAGAIIDSDTVIGDDTIVNLKASVSHGCVIGAHCHIAPGCTLSGGVSVGEGTHIGTGTSVIQGIKIAPNCLVGAGSVVVGDIPPRVKAFGNPCRVRGEFDGGGYNSVVYFHDTSLFQRCAA